jgi:hypothetical protein
MPTKISTGSRIRHSWSWSGPLAENFYVFFFSFFTRIKFFINWLLIPIFSWSMSDVEEHMVWVSALLGRRVIRIPEQTKVPVVIDKLLECHGGWVLVPIISIGGISFDRRLLWAGDAGRTSTGEFWGRFRHLWTGLCVQIGS